jgi:twitching motility two-component system response regulator PilG
VSQSAAMTLLREGIAAAKAGDKARTRLLLREVTQLEPRNELAWLWMAGVAETAQDSVASLEKVLEINPSNTRARDGLKMARLQSGIAEAKAGNKARARKFLLDVTQQDPRSEMAWMWLAGVAEAPLDTVAHLQRVVEINPDNTRAREGLKTARLQAGVALGRAGNREAARQMFLEVTEQDPRNELAWQWLAAVAASLQDAIVCLDRVLQLNPGNERARTGLNQYRAQLAAASPRWTCPLCLTAANTPAHRCPACGCVLSLADPLALLAANPTAPAKARAAAERLERVVQRSPDFTSRFQLGLAYFNLKQYDPGLTQLQEAARVVPADQGFRSQVNALVRAVANHNGAQPEKPPEAPKKYNGFILVVDDSPTVRKLVSMTMEKHGYRVVTAADGYEATDQVCKELPDLILMDITMPGMDGYQLCRLIKNNPETAKVPVVMLSGKDGFFDKIRGRLAGSTQYLTKPFKPEVLLQAVKKHCRPKV